MTYGKITFYHYNYNTFKRHTNLYRGGLLVAVLSVGKQVLDRCQSGLPGVEAKLVAQLPVNTIITKTTPTLL